MHYIEGMQVWQFLDLDLLAALSQVDDEYSYEQMQETKANHQYTLRKAQECP